MKIIDEFHKNLRQRVICINRIVRTYRSSLSYLSSSLSLFLSLSSSNLYSSVSFFNFFYVQSNSVSTDDTVRR